MNGLHLQTVLQAGLVVLLSLGYLYHIREGTSWILTRREDNKRQKKAEKRVDQGVFLLLLAAWLLFVVPILLDFPYFVNEKYEVVTGIVTSEDIREPGKKKVRDLVVQDYMSKEEVLVHVMEKGVPHGAIVEVKYLPHTDNGEVLFMKVDSDEGLQTAVSSKQNAVLRDVVMLAVLLLGLFEVWVWIHARNAEHDQTLHSRT